MELTYEQETARLRAMDVICSSYRHVCYSDCDKFRRWRTRLEKTYLTRVNVNRVKFMRLLLQLNKRYCMYDFIFDNIADYRTFCEVIRARGLDIDDFRIICVGFRGAYGVKNIDTKSIVPSRNKLMSQSGVSWYEKNMKAKRRGTEKELKTEYKKCGQKLQEKLTPMEHAQLRKRMRINKRKLRAQGPFELYNKFNALVDNVGSIANPIAEFKETLDSFREGISDQSIIDKVGLLVSDLIMLARNFDMVNVLITLFKLCCYLGLGTSMFNYICNLISGGVLRCQGGFMDAMTIDFESVASGISSHAEGIWSCVAIVGFILPTFYFKIPQSILKQDLPGFLFDFKRIFEGLKSISGLWDWVSTWVQDRYFSYFYGMSKVEYECCKIVPSFKKFINDVILLEKVDGTAFQRNEKLCSHVKLMYRISQQLVGKISVKDSTIASEMRIVFTKMFDRFMRIYEKAKNSPFFYDIVRTKPIGLYLYGRSGVGKSNLTNLLVCKLHKELYGGNKPMQSVMWTRRAANEYFDGYANQPFVVYDDFFQSIDSKTKSNPEILEIIYASNDAPYQLHMSDIKDKSSTYFDSEHLIASSNVKRPDPESIHDAQALRRRFDIVCEVRVAPAKGKTTGGPNAYYRIDETKVTSSLDTSVWEVVMYDMETGNNLPDPNNPSQAWTMDFDAFVEHYKKVYRERKIKDASVKEELNKFLGVHVPMKDDVVEGVLGSLKCEVGLENPEEYLFGSDGPSLNEYQDQNLLDILNRSAPDFSQINVEDDDAEYVAPSTEVYTQPPLQRWYESFFDRCTNYFNKAVDLVSDWRWYIFTGVGIVISYLLVKRWNKCRVFEKVNGVYDVFVNMCRNSCNVCDILKGNVSSVHLFQPGEHYPTFRSNFNKECAEILGLYHPSIAQSDVARDFISLHRQVSRNRSRVPKKQYDLSVQDYSRGCMPSLKIQDYTSERGAGLRMQITPDMLDVHCQIGADKKTFRDMLVSNVVDPALQQSLPLYYSNMTIIEFKNGARALCLFVKGRIALMPQHYTSFMQDSFTIHNMFVGGVGTEVKTAECRFEQVYKDPKNECPVDLMCVEFPLCMPSRRDITGRFVDANQQHIVPTDDVSVIRIRDFKSVPTILVENSGVCVNAQEKYDGVKILNSYRYNIRTEKGDCGSVVLTRSNAISRKIVGIHTAGTGHQGAAQSITRQALENCIAKFGTVITLPEQLGTQHGELLDIGDCVSQGKLDKVGPQASKTKIKKSKLQRTIVPTCKPAHLAPFTNKEGERVDPMEKGLKKVGNFQTRVDADLLNIATQDVLQVLDNGEDRRVLSIEESIAGVEGDEYINGIIRKTAPGYPWNLHKDKPGKHTWLSDENGDYRVDDPRLLTAIDERIQLAKRGVRSPTFSTATLKDERRPIAKVDEGKTRVFAAVPMDFLVVFRQYFSSFVAQQMDDRIWNEIAVGLDHNVEWRNVVDYLMEFPEGGFIAGDFSNFDGSLIQEVVWRVCDIVNAWYDDGEENALIRRVLFEEVCNALVIVRGEVVQWTHSQPSGNPMTTFVNSIFQMIMFRVVYLHLKREKGMPLLCDFSDNVRMITFGDDGVLNVHPRVREWYSQVEITRVMKLYGLTYTNESKDDREFVHRDLSEVSFLKRGFKRLCGEWVGPLEPDVIREMMLWYTGPCEREAVEENIGNALREAVLHGQEFYDELVKQLKKQKHYSVRYHSWESMWQQRLYDISCMY